MTRDRRTIPPVEAYYYRSREARDMGPQLSEYPYKLIHEQAVRLGGTPKEDAVMPAWRVEYRRQVGGWRHFILLLDAAPTPRQVLEACRIHERLER